MPEFTYPTASATNADLELFLGVADDTRREILRALGLPKRRRYPWTECWNALGLMPGQPEALWPELMLGAERKNRLWTAARVASEIGKATATVNGWCQTGTGPKNFPAPLLDLGPKVRRWLPIEVQAYNQPSIYGEMAACIRRKPPAPTAKKSTGQPLAASIAVTGTLQPLPPPP